MFKNIKTTLNKTPKYVSLILLASGFVYSVRELASADPYLTGLGIILGLLLIEKAAK